MAVFRNGLSIEIDDRATQRSLRRVARKYPRIAVSRMRAAAILVQSEAKRLVLSGPASGRLYTRRGITHRASAPGQPPMSDTGTLARSIHVDDTAARTRLRVSVVAGAKYAPHLQLGTVKMRARPFMDVALKNKINEVRRIIRAPIKGNR